MNNIFGTFGKILVILAVTGAVLLPGGPARAAATVATLDGAYHFVSTGAEFWKNTVGGVTVFDGNAASVGVLTFDGNGVCALDYEESTFAVGFTVDKDKVSVEQEDDDATPCTYSVSPDGEVSLVFADGTETFRAGEDGNMLVQGGGWEDSESGGVGYGAALTVAVKAGTGLDNESLNGTFKAVSLDSTFDLAGSNVRKSIYANTVTLTFNGNGGFTASVDGREFGIDFSAPTVISDDPGKENLSGTYLVAADGTVTMTIPGEDPMSFWLSADGSVLISGGAAVYEDDDGSTMHEVRQFVAVKTGSGLSKATLNGSYAAFSLERGFRRTGNAVSSGIAAGAYAMNFDGKGKCSLSFQEEEFEVSFAAPNSVSSSPDGDTASCTYKVSAAGDVAIKFADGSKASAWLSDDGNSLIDGGAFLQGSDYATSLLVMTKTGGPAPVASAWLVSAKANAGGTLTVDGDAVKSFSVPAGETRILVITPDPGFHIVSIVADGEVLASDSAPVAPYLYTEPYNVTVPDDLDPDLQKHKIAVKFAANRYPAEAIPPAAGGRITPVGPKAYKHGKAAMYTIRADSGFAIASVLVNGVPQDLGNGDLTKPFKLKLTIEESKTVQATFVALP